MTTIQWQRGDATVPVLFYDKGNCGSTNYLQRKLERLKQQACLNERLMDVLLQHKNLLVLLKILRQTCLLWHHCLLGTILQLKGKRLQLQYQSLFRKTLLLSHRRLLSAAPATEAVKLHVCSGEPAWSYCSWVKVYSAEALGTVQQPLYATTGKKKLSSESFDLSWIAAFFNIIFILSTIIFSRIGCAPSRVRKWYALPRTRSISWGRGGN